MGYLLQMPRTRVMPLAKSTLLKRRFSLHEWIWRAFVRGALIPLVLVETVLIAVYLLTNTAIRDAQTEYLRTVAVSELETASHRESHLINEQLARVSTMTELYRNLTAQALRVEPSASLAPPSLALLPSGVRYSPQDNGGAASFYSGVTPADQQDLHRVAQLASLDPLMKEIKERHPLVASLYFNTWDSYNHIYPWFFTPDQYPHDLAIPTFNFYYLADASHNPERRQLWTDVYLDPAGQGWMMSAIAPVYRGDFLEGVVGLDITVSTLLEQISQLNVPWNGYAMLVSDRLNIMALPKAGEHDFGLRELTHHSYEEAIRKELFKPEDFNLAGRQQTAELAKQMTAQPEGRMALRLDDGEIHLVAWNTVEQTGWHLLMVVPEEEVYAETDSLSHRYQQIGYLMIAGLLVFYLLFFSFLWWRAQHLSKALQVPIVGIRQMMAQIGEGHWRPAAVDSEIRELNDMVRHTATMGTQLERSEQQRDKTQQRLELVLDSATESLWEHDQQTGWIFLRGGFCQRFGLASDSISEEAFLQRIHPDDVARFKMSRTLIEENNGLCEAEFRFRDAGNHYHWLLGRGRVVEYDSATGEPRLLAGTYVDIDALKSTEEDLRQASLEAQAASQAKSRFISSVSHELRTPLNAIHGFAQLMQIEQEAKRDQGQGNELEYLTEILVASRHLGALVDDILGWASIQAEKPRLDLQQVNVAHLLAECAELIRLEVETQGLHLELSPVDPSLTLEVDPRRLRQVMLNLLSNAIKYNRPGGHIILSAQALSGRVRLKVEDNGQGISSALQSKLFEPFQRLGQENTAIQGTGIGLSLCREFAQLLGGEIGLHSELGQGSCFWIELPLLEVLDIAEQHLAAASLSAPVLGMHQILYVQDHPEQPARAAEALAGLAQVTLASSAAMALEQAQIHAPDLLVLDLNLPDMTGEKLIQQLRCRSNLQNMPVVVLINEAEIERLMALSFQGVLLYPLNLDDLRDQVTALLQEAH